MDQKHRTCSGLNIKSIGFGKEGKGLERKGKDKQRFMFYFAFLFVLSIPTIYDLV